MKRMLWVIVVALLVAGAGALGWWSARTALLPETTQREQTTQAVWAEAVAGEVGRTLPYSTTLRQPTSLVATNGLTGVVTSVNPGQVAWGDVLYVVGDTPVRAVQADEPMWRELAQGQRGKDVQALQRMLSALGYFRGFADGDFGEATGQAVKAWQKAEKREETGTVQLGELVALRQLPVSVSLAAEIAPGKLLAGGEDAVLAPTGEREFVLVITAEQARQVPAEATVEVTFEDLTWTAVIVGTSNEEGGNVVHQLAGVDGGEVCGADCGRLPLDPTVTLRSSVVVVPRVSGTAVPAAAVRSAPDGAAFVVTEAGERPVTVLGSGQGLAIVEGIELGTRVQLAQAAPAQPSAPSTEES